MQKDSTNNQEILFSSSSLGLEAKVLESHIELIELLTSLKHCRTTGLQDIGARIDRKVRPEKESIAKMFMGPLSKPFVHFSTRCLATETQLFILSHHIPLACLLIAFRCHIILKYNHLDNKICRKYSIDLYSALCIQVEEQKNVINP